MTQEAQSRCNFFMWTLQWLSRIHPSTSPHQIFSLLKICINEETSSCGKMCAAHGPNVSSSFCNKSSACIYRGITTFVHVCMHIVCESCIIILWGMIVPSDCVPTRQTDVTPGLLCTGDSRRRRDPEGVTVTTTGNTFRTYWWVSDLLTALFNVTFGGVLLLRTRLNLEI